MHKPESVLENEMHNVHSDLLTQTNHLILARRSDVAIIDKNEKLSYSGFWCSSGPQSENQRETSTCWRTKKKKAVRYEGEDDSNCNCALETVPKGLEMGLEELEIKGRIETIQT